MGYLLINADWKHPKLLTPGWVKLLEGKKVHRVLPGTWLVAGRRDEHQALLGRVVDGLRHGDTLVSRYVHREVWTEKGAWGPEPVPDLESTGTPTPWLLALDVDSPRRVDAIQESLNHLTQALGVGPCHRLSRTLLGFRMDAGSSPLSAFCAQHLAESDRFVLAVQNEPSTD
jgi:hypothetical protein